MMESESSGIRWTAAFFASVLLHVVLIGGWFWLMGPQASTGGESAVEGAAEEAVATPEEAISETPAPRPETELETTSTTSPTATIPASLSGYLPPEENTSSSVKPRTDARASQAVTPRTSLAPAPKTEAASTLPDTYRIKKGDTLSRVAKAHGLTLSELLKINKMTLKGSSSLQIGQIIKLK